MKDLNYFKTELKEAEQNISSLIENHLKKKDFDTKRFLNFSTMTFLDFKTFHSFKIVSSENFYDKTKNCKSSTKHQIFFLGNKKLKTSNKDDLIEEISVGYRLLGFWELYKSLKKELIANFYIKFDTFLSIRKLTEMEKIKKDYKEENSFYFNLLKEKQTEEFIKWDLFIKKIENDEKIYEEELSEILSEERENRKNKKS